MSGFKNQLGDVPYVPPPRAFDGITYNSFRDYDRLNGALSRLLRLMKDGRERTLQEIAEHVGCETQSASARIRDLKKEKYGKHRIDKRPLGAVCGAIGTSNSEVSVMLTPERVRHLLNYDADTGLFTWRRNHFRARAGSVSDYDQDGYVCVAVGGERYKAHRLAWFWMTGLWPPSEIDHKNGIRSDNRWENLRLSTPSLNHANSKLIRTNKSGFKGVHNKEGRWVATIMKNKQSFHLGSFDTPEAAHAAYVAAANQLFGEFARLK